MYELVIKRKKKSEIAETRSKGIGLTITFSFSCLKRLGWYPKQFARKVVKIMLMANILASLLATWQKYSVLEFFSSLLANKRITIPIAVLARATTDEEMKEYPSLTSASSSSFCFYFITLFKIMIRIMATSIQRQLTIVLLFSSLFFSEVLPILAQRMSLAAGAWETLILFFPKKRRSIDWQ